MTVVNNWMMLFSSNNSKSWKGLQVTLSYNLWCTESQNIRTGKTLNKLFSPTLSVNRGGNWGPERRSILPNITEWVKSSARVEPKCHFQVLSTTIKYNALICSDVQIPNLLLIESSRKITLAHGLIWLFHFILDYEPLMETAYANGSFPPLPQLGRISVSIHWTHTKNCSPPCPCPVNRIYSHIQWMPVLQLVFLNPGKTDG